MSRAAALVLVVLALAGCATPGPAPADGAPADPAPPGSGSGPGTPGPLRVAEVAVEPESVLVGDSTVLTFVVENPSAAEATGALDVRVDGRVVRRVEVTVPASGVAREEVEVALDRPGNATVAVGTRAARVAVRVPVGSAGAHDGADLGAPAEKAPWRDPPDAPAGYLDYDAERYLVLERTVHGTRVVVPVHRGWLDRAEIGGFAARPPEEFAELVFRVFEHHWHVFGGLPRSEVRVVVHGPDDPCGFVGATPVGHPWCARDSALRAGEGGRPPHPLTRDFPAELLAHELFHVWLTGAVPATPRDVEGFPEEAWVTEGATAYYAARALATEWSLAGYERAMQGELDRYARLLPAAGNLSMAELAGRTPPPREPSPFTDMLYARGALAAHALDAKLASRGRSLDDVMRALYTELALAGRTWNSSDVEAVAERLAGGNLTTFDEFVRGRATLPARVDFVDHVTPRVRPAVGVRDASAD